MKVILTLGIGVIFVFFDIILFKKEKQAHDTFLLLLLMTTIGILLTDLFYWTSITHWSIFFNKILTVWNFSWLLSYGMVLVGSKKNLRLKSIWIYALALAYSIFEFTRMWKFTDIPAYELVRNPKLVDSLVFHLKQVYFILGSIWLVGKVNVYQKTIKSYYSSIEPFELSWLKNFCLALIVLNSFAFVAFLLYDFNWIRNLDHIYAVYNVSILIVVFYVVFKGVPQYAITYVELVNKLAYAPVKENSLGTKVKYLGSSLSDEKMDTIYRDLNTLFKESEIFTNQGLKIAEVAEELNYPAHELSQVINTKFGRPFYDYVSTFRVEMLQELLVHPDSKKYTILSLALDCGFSSKASLNRVFKEHTGLTPSQYQRNHLKTVSTGAQ